MELILFISLLCFALAFVCSMLAGRFSAIQDTVKYHPDKSIFNKPELYNTKKFGIDYEYWYNLNGHASWLAKYNDYDKTKGKRKTKILFFRLHLVQLYDAWHYYKMWKIGMYNLSDLFSSAATVLLFAYMVFVRSLGTGDAALIIAGALFIYYWINGAAWIVSFNKHYDDWLLK